MSLSQAFNISLGGMSAQALRLNLVASNIANADVSSATESGAYRSVRPFFQAVEQASGAQSVNVSQIVKSNAPAKLKYDPSDPLANAQGYVYKSNVDLAAEMADMISASRSYQLNADVAQVSKSLMDRVLSIGQ